MTKLFSIIFKIFLYFSVIVLLGGLGLLLAFLFIRSAEAISMEKLQIAAEILPAVAGTVVVTLLSVGIAAPLGVTLGVFINEYTRGKSKEFLIFIFKVLGGIPSIVVGIFGFIIIIFFFKIIPMGLRPSLLVSALSLALLVLPYIVHSTIIALRSIPVNERLSGLSMGAQKYQNIIHVLLPHSTRSIFSGIILAIGRSAEDTAVIMLTGAAVMAGFPTSLLRPFEALPFFIYIRSTEYRHPDELAYVYIASVIIIAVCSLLMAASYYTQKKIMQKVSS